jgi:GT2 family glycosyltransferase
MYSYKDIAIVILNWNGKSLLEQCLPSVVNYSNNAQIYVADNASTDNSIAFIKTNYPNITIIKNSKNLGFAEGYNLALTSVKEPLLCLLNNDVEVTPQWLEPILDLYNTQGNLAIVQPKILDYNKRDTFEYAGAAGGFMDKYGYPYCRGRIFNHIEKDTGQYDDVKEILWASGACFFIKSSVYNNLGGFDNSFFAHMEEIDLCWRAFNQNFKIVYSGYSTVYHIGGATLSNQNPKKTYLNFRNSLYALTKNTDKNLFGRIFVRLILDGIAGLRFLAQLKISHFISILKAHFSFYSKFPELLKQRRELTQRAGYFKINSIVWSYFILKKTQF